MRNFFKGLWEFLSVFGGPPLQLQIWEWQAKCAEEAYRRSTNSFERSTRSIRSQAIRKAFDRKPIRAPR